MSLSGSLMRRMRYCGQNLMRLRGCVKLRQRPQNSCSSWRLMQENCRTNAACWRTASSRWRGRTSPCRQRWTQRNESKPRALRLSLIYRVNVYSFFWKYLINSQATVFIPIPPLIRSTNLWFGGRSETSETSPIQSWDREEATSGEANRPGEGKQILSFSYSFPPLL